MANNIFTGTFYNENDEKIKGSVVKYYGIHRNNSGKLSISNTRIAEDDMYNFNLIDPDWLGNDVPFITGEQIAIIAWEDQSLPENSSELTRFGLIFFSNQSKDTYVQDIQLLPKARPKCGLTYTLGKTGSVSVFDSGASDQYQWIYKDMEHHHRDSIFGHDTFNINNLTIEYSYEEDVWVTTNEYTFSESGSYTVKTRITDSFGLVSNCVKTFDIVNFPPVGNISFDKTTPILNDILTITANITDQNNTIISITHIWDDEVVEENTDLYFVYEQTLTENKTHVAKQIIVWYDGFEEQTLTYTKNLSMGNIPPEFEIEEEDVVSVENGKKYSILDLVDPDGDDNQVKIKWMIEYKTPIDNEYKIVYNPGYPSTINTEPKEWIFNVSGEYKVTATARDQGGLETTKSVITYIEGSSSSDCEGTGSILLNNNTKQLISIPVMNKNVGEYFINKVRDAIQSYSINYLASDVIEVCIAYPGHINKHLSFIPDHTDLSSTHNFSLVMTDNNINEILGFWIIVKDYKKLTDNEDIIISWDQGDSL